MNKEFKNDIMQILDRIYYDDMDGGGLNQDEAFEAIREIFIYSLISESYISSMLLATGFSPDEANEIAKTIRSEQVKKIIGASY